MIYVLTRTAGRPTMFRRLRQNLAQSGVRVTHVVHSDDPTDTYPDGDIVIEGPRLPIGPGKYYGPELYIARCLQAIRDFEPGWVVIVDDDDVFLPGALRRIRDITDTANPDTMPVWKVRREAGRISPQAWRAPLHGTGKLCWEGAAFHTSHIPEAIPLIKPVDIGDAQFWAGMSKLLRVEWHDFIATEPQRRGHAGKGKGFRADGPLITVAVPILNRPQRISNVAHAFRDPRCEVLFLPDETDEASIRVLETGRHQYALAPPAEKWGCPTYSSKVNHAYRVTETPFLLYAADDVKTKVDWATQALAHLEDEAIGLLATNDQMHHLVRRGRLATHGIIRRSYVEQYGSASLPDSGPVFHEGYRHWCCDVEISQVAHQRGAFRYAPDVVIAHERSRRNDKTYQLGQSFAEQDRALARERVPDWGHHEPQHLRSRETEGQRASV